MRVKVFSAEHGSELTKLVNDWLDANPDARVRERQMCAAGAGGNASFGARGLCFIALWYDIPGATT